jgi:hypothetical protein
MRDQHVRLPLAGIRLSEARTGEPVHLADLPGAQVLTLIRHRFWLPCQEHLVQVQQCLTGTGVGLVTVGFSPPAALRAPADHLELTGPVLSDEQRRVYRLFGLRRAPVWRIYSPGTLAHYARAMLRGRRRRRPVEDTRQLVGDALMVDGVVVRRWRPRSPDDRVAPQLLADTAVHARAVAGTGSLGAELAQGRGVEEPD